MTTIYPVIMCGGAGTRLWPISRQNAPKQYHALVNERTMLEDTIVRISGVQDLDVAPPSFVSAEAHADLIRTQCDNLGLSPLFMILEPFGRNTAPVAAIISMVIKEHDPNGIVLLLPADHYIQDKGAFWQRVADGIALASSDQLVTLGIQPTSPHTGYGYIQRGDKHDHNTFTVKNFVEKPGLSVAKNVSGFG